MTEMDLGWQEQQHKLVEKKEKVASDLELQAV